MCKVLSLLAVAVIAFVQTNAFCANDNPGSAKTNPQDIKSFEGESFKQATLVEGALIEAYRISTDLQPLIGKGVILQGIDNKSLFTTANTSQLAGSEEYGTTSLACKWSGYFEAKAEGEYRFRCQPTSNRSGYFDGDILATVSVAGVNICNYTGNFTPKEPFEKVVRLGAGYHKVEIWLASEKKVVSTKWPKLDLKVRSDVSSPFVSISPAVMYHLTK